MTAWSRDLQSWVDSWFKGKAPKNQFDRTEKIAKRGGWDPSKYKSSMRQKLHSWLTKWYTLAVKDMPEPATRRNPIKNTLYDYYVELLGEDE